jgi:hypothetical protein
MYWRDDERKFSGCLTLLIFDEDHFEAATQPLLKVTLKHDGGTSNVWTFNAQSRQLMTVVAEQLRQIWNARGAADMHAVTDFGVSGLQTEDTRRDALIAVLRRLDR